MDQIIEDAKNELYILIEQHMENGKYTQNDMTGTIWMELQTKTGSKGEYNVYSGSAKIGGKEMWVNAYPKQLASGKEILSLTFKLKQERPMTQSDFARIENEQVQNVDLSQAPF